VIEIFPAYEEDKVLRVEMFGDDVERWSRSIRCAARSCAT
jgi:excinuclease UvrABC helicase subunit UvrB